MRHNWYWYPLNMNRNNLFYYIHVLKQWIALNGCADWLLKLRISFAIHLRAIRVEFAPENVVIFAGINELNHLFMLYYLIVLVLY